MKKLSASYTEPPDSIVGAWSINCAECPLKEHLTALKMPLRDCMNGIQTRAQGHVPLSTCEHYQKDSFKGVKKNVFELTCNFSTPLAKSQSEESHLSAGPGTPVSNG